MSFKINTSPYYLEVNKFILKSKNILLKKYQINFYFI